jgi:hypothetical protein
VLLLDEGGREIKKRRVEGPDGQVALVPDPLASTSARSLGQSTPGASPPGPSSQPHSLPAHIAMLLQQSDMNAGGAGSVSAGFSQPTATTGLLAALQHSHAMQGSALGQGNDQQTLLQQLAQSLYVGNSSASSYTAQQSTSDMPNLLQPHFMPGSLEHHQVQPMPSNMGGMLSNAALLNQQLSMFLQYQTQAAAAAATGSRAMFPHAGESIFGDTNNVSALLGGPFQLQQLQQRQHQQQQTNSNNHLSAFSPGNLPPTPQQSFPGPKVNPSAAFAATALSSKPRLSPKRSSSSSLGSSGALQPKASSPAHPPKKLPLSSLSKAAATAPPNSQPPLQGPSKTQPPAVASSSSSSPRGSKNTIMQPILLYSPSDEVALSAYQCLVRQQIEMFEATDDDVQFNVSKMSKMIALGQVGIRCRHCSTLPQYSRPKAAVYYPRSLDSLYQFGQNMVKNHLCGTCTLIPPETRRKLMELQEERRRGKGGRERWSEAAREVGVFEEGDGLRFK